jgi:tight adherence protein C
MNHEPLLMLFVFGGGILVLVAAASLLLFGEIREQEIAHRISGLRKGATVSRARSYRFLPLLLVLVRRIGETMRDRMLSARDAGALAKSLAASGFEPAKAMPIFIGAKITGLLVIPTSVYFGAMLLSYPIGKQLLCTAASAVIGMMLPNWIVSFIGRSYQTTLRRGIPDALDLMVVCAQAGLGFESAVERVAREMKQSNRPVGVEFTLLTSEMRVHPDRRVALTNLAERTGQPALKRLAGTIAQTLKYGTPLSQGLRTLAADMRNERMIQFEERAGKLPALLVGPMILFILPCLFIVILGKPITGVIAMFAAMSH